MSHTTLRYVFFEHRQARAPCSRSALGCATTTPLASSSHLARPLLFLALQLVLALRSPLPSISCKLSYLAFPCPPPFAWPLPRLSPLLQLLRALYLLRARCAWRSIRHFTLPRIDPSPRVSSPSILSTFARITCLLIISCCSPTLAFTHRMSEEDKVAETGVVEETV
jgi:hypothetical protein